MKQSSPKWAEAYARLIELVQKYGTQTPSVDELDVLMESIKTAMKDDVEHCNAVQDKFAAKVTIDEFCTLMETVLRQK